MQDDGTDRAAACDLSEHKVWHRTCENAHYRTGSVHRHVVGPSKMQEVFRIFPWIIVENMVKYL